MIPAVCFRGVSFLKWPAPCCDTNNEEDQCNNSNSKNNSVIWKSHFFDVKLQKKKGTRKNEVGKVKFHAKKLRTNLWLLFFYFLNIKLFRSTQHSCLWRRMELQRNFYGKEKRKSTFEFCTSCALFDTSLLCWEIQRKTKRSFETSLFHIFFWSS